jgi:D-2-hydroxyacid dehydrogenase (NADP+)
MTGILISERFPPDALQRLRAAAQHELRLIHLPPDPEARLTEEEVTAIDVAFYSSDIYETRNRSFFSAVQKAPKLAWMHTFNAGVDHPVFARLLAKGMRLSTSAGVAAVPIAQSAITGLLMLARGFPAWLQAQREHRWAQIRGAGQPADLAGQTLCVLGLGSIGAEIARLGQALGLNVIGIRRSPRRADDPVAEIQPPSALAQVLPRCQWLALACPLTPETRKRIDAGAIAHLPRGARLINVARGEIIDEAAMIEALQSGHLTGAYLDVFEKEPLPADSLLWDLPNVIVTPHNSGASSGNDARVLELFVHNFSQWVKTQPMKNEVLRASA